MAVYGEHQHKVSTDVSPDLLTNTWPPVRRQSRYPRVNPFRWLKRDKKGKSVSRRRTRRDLSRSEHKEQRTTVHIHSARAGPLAPGADYTEGHTGKDCSMSKYPERHSPSSDHPEKCPPSSDHPEKCPPSSDHPEKCPPSSDHPEKCPPSSDHLEKCPPSSDHLEKCPPSSDHPEKCPPSSDHPEKCPPSSDHPEKCPPSSDHPEKCPPSSDHPEKCPPSSDQPEKCPPSSDHPEKCPPTSDHLEKCSPNSDHLEKCAPASHQPEKCPPTSHHPEKHPKTTWLTPGVETFTSGITEPQDDKPKKNTEGVEPQNSATLQENDIDDKVTPASLQNMLPTGKDAMREAPSHMGNTHNTQTEDLKAAVQINKNKTTQYQPKTNLELKGKKDLSENAVNQQTQTGLDGPETSKKTKIEDSLDSPKKSISYRGPSQDLPSPKHYKTSTSQQAKGIRRTNLTKGKRLFGPDRKKHVRFSDVVTMFLIEPRKDTKWSAGETVLRARDMQYFTNLHAESKQMSPGTASTAAEKSVTVAGKINLSKERGEDWQPVRKRSAEATECHGLLKRAKRSVTLHEVEEKPKETVTERSQAGREETILSECDAKIDTPMAQALPPVRMFHVSKKHKAHGSSCTVQAKPTGKPAKSAMTSACEAGTDSVGTESMVTELDIKVDLGHTTRTSKNATKCTNQTSKGETGSSDSTSKKDMRPSDSTSKKDMRPSDSTSKRDMRPSDSTSKRDMRPSDTTSERGMRSSGTTSEKESGPLNTTSEIEPGPSDTTSKGEIRPSDMISKREKKHLSGVKAGSDHSMPAAKAWTGARHINKTDATMEREYRGGKTGTESTLGASKTKHGNTKKAGSKGFVAENYAIKTETEPTKSVNKAEIKHDHGASMVENELADRTRRVDTVRILQRPGKGRKTNRACITQKTFTPMPGPSKITLTSTDNTNQEGSAKNFQKSSSPHTKCHKFAGIKQSPDSRSNAEKKRKPVQDMDSEELVGLTDTNGELDPETRRVGDHLLFVNKSSMPPSPVGKKQNLYGKHELSSSVKLKSPPRIKAESKNCLEDNQVNAGHQSKQSPEQKAHEFTQMKSSPQLVRVGSKGLSRTEEPTEDSNGEGQHVIEGRGLITPVQNFAKPSSQAHARKKSHMCSDCLGATQKSQKSNDNPTTSQNKIKVSKSLSSIAADSFMAAIPPDIQTGLRKPKRRKEPENGTGPPQDNQDLNPKDKDHLGKRLQGPGAKNLSPASATHQLLGEEPCACTKCGKCIVTNADQSSSSSDPKGNLRVKRRRKAFLVKEPYKCKECGKIFTRHFSLLQHQSIHTGEKPFTCQECGKKFRDNNSLKSHMRSHTKEKPFTCLECGKGFSQQSSVIVHQRIHTDERPFQCEECGKSFNDRSTYRHHVRIHTGEKPFACSFCGKKFTQLAHVSRHEKIHTGERPFGCTVCEKRFIDRAKLIKHEMIHKRDKD
uniref:C2H2-type domain-containing protein n=1 Tax=Leptobrachium leishanense TaxID=445787 RepID=A0A8C5QSE2_9ANUR